MSVRFTERGVGRYFFQAGFVLLSALCVHTGYISSFVAVYPADWKILETGYWKTHSSYHISGSYGPAPVQLPGPLDAWAGGAPKEI